jgi:pyrimidine operon attenuation protein/uracil phosphoribosyltransferase
MARRAVRSGADVHPSAETRCCLYTTAELQAVLDAMADQVAARWPPDRPPVVIGILRRGAPLADRLVERLVERHQLPAPMRLDLSVKRYADDLRLLYPETRLDEGAPFAEADLAGRSLLLVDDVLYSGHSMARVVAHLLNRRPAEIRIATLVDRGVARLPIRADVVGVRLQVPPGSIVECHVPPYEPDFRIERVRPAPDGA